MSYPFCIGTKRGVNHGIVYLHDGTVVGHVKRHARVARKDLGGGTQQFWTANVMVDGKVVGASLGTRHLTRLSAARAVVAFAQAVGRIDLDAIVAADDTLPAWAAGHPEYSRSIVAGRLTGEWKSMNPTLCALAA